MFFLDLLNPCVKSTWYDVFEDVLLKRLTLVFSRVYNDIKGTGQRDANIMVLSIFPGGPMLQIPPSTWRKARDFLSSSNRYCPICALLNQFCSLLSASTPIALRLNFSDLPLSLETFNKEDIFISTPFLDQKLFASGYKIQKTTHVYAHNASLSLFSSSDMHQSHHLDGCQIMGANSSFIEAF